MRFLFILSISIFSLSTAMAQNGYDYDYVPDATYEEVADRLSCINTDIPLNYNAKVKSFIDYFTVRDRKYTKDVLSRTQLYFPIFEAALEKYNLPKELKYLAIVESGLRPNAVSRASAVGLWQFMAATGKMYGLNGDWYVDERMDPYESSDAAARHLKDLYTMFGDWELALAAYNCGSGNVRKAISRSGQKRKFWEIYNYLPRETRSYVPQFVAIAYTFHFAEDHNIFVDEYQSIPDFDTIHVSQYFHLETFANQINVGLEDILLLNPQIKRGALPEGTRNFGLKVPKDLKEFIVANRMALYDTAGKVGRVELDRLAQNTPGSVYGKTKQIYKVRSGDVLGSIAERYNVSVADLRKWNNISGNMIRAGQNLNVWVLPSYNSQSKSLYASSAPKPSPKSVEGKQVHQVQAGESLWSIANAYAGLSIERLKQLNNLINNTIKPGQLLIISVE